MTPQSKLEREHALAQAIVDTVREPLLVLDEELRVVVASRSFYQKFHLDPERTQGKLLGALGDGQWDLPALHALLNRIGPDNAVLEDYEIELDFPQLGGRRLFLANARRVFYEGDQSVRILLAFEDVTARRLLERERNELLRQKNVLLEEVQHRISNSLAIIASILLMKARTVTSSETRAHLQDAHNRVMSVATVQQHLHPSEMGVSIELRSYLKQLCRSLADSMISDDSCLIDTHVSESSVSSATAVSLGLIVTELVINAMKHAFPKARTGGVIAVGYEVNGTDWKLSVSDNGLNEEAGSRPHPRIGLGTNIVSALAESLDARVDTTRGPSGTTVAVTHSTFKSLPKAA
jgi:chemotaxis protein methyltransferase CheR